MSCVSFSGCDGMSDGAYHTPLLKRTRRSAGFCRLVDCGSVGRVGRLGLSGGFGLGRYILLLLMMLGAALNFAFSAGFWGSGSGVRHGAAGIRSDEMGSAVGGAMAYIA